MADYCKGKIISFPQLHYHSPQLSPMVVAPEDEQKGAGEMADTCVHGGS